MENNDKKIDKEKIDKEFQQSKSKAEEMLGDANTTRLTIDEAEKKAEKVKDLLGEVWENLQLMLSLIKDYISGKYRDISASSIIAILGGIIYFLSPFDAIPDFIPVFGLIDDVFVLKLVYDRIKVDLEKYKEWIDQNSK